LLLLLFYGAVFVFLVQFQFARKTEFTLRTANLVVQGNYGPAGPVRIPNAYPLAGKISVFFGGMEFLLGEGTLYGDRGRIAAGPDMMTLTDNDVYFQFAEGPELTFTTQYTGGAIELVIHGDFSGGGGDGGDGSGVDGDGSGGSGESGSGADSESGESAASGSGGSSPWRSLEIPFRPLETSLVREDSASFLLNADGTGYTFSRQTGPGRKVVLESRNPEISYRALQDEAVNPEQFIIPAALDTGVYGTALSLWLDKSYSFWNSAISRNVPAEHESSGELVSAYMNEALKRGVYRAAAAVSSAYQTPSWEGSAYVGRLDGAMRGLSTVEREKSARLARLFNERSAEFLKEFRVIEFLAVRGYTSLMDDAADILRRFDPAAMGAAEAAGILEGRLDWERYRTGHNPYERFVNQALFVITRDLRNDPRTGSALVFVNGEAGTELNLRLGNALVHYENETRAALGRTLLLSVLSLADDSGAAPRVVRQSAGGTFTGSPGRLDSSRIYRICFAGENYARPQPLGGSLWAWTAASSVSASASAAPGRIDIQVQFPPGETHYMMIRGLRPPAGFELNGIVLNQDPQFERYEGSGWAYAAAEQTLLVKLRHRQGLERLSVLY
jgi:hypothetical protein